MKKLLDAIKRFMLRLFIDNEPEKSEFHAKTRYNMMEEKKNV